LISFFAIENTCKELYILNAQFTLEITQCSSVQRMELKEMENSVGTESVT